MLGWLTGGISKVIQSTGDAVNKNVRTLKGDVAERDKQLHEEQLAILAQFTAEFVARPTRNWLDSFVDALNRLPRPLFTFGIFWLFVLAWYNPGAFIDFMASVAIIPDSLWTLLLMVVAFWFSSRIISEDLKKPKLNPEQQAKALEIIRQRAEALEKATEPDIIIAVPIPEPTLPPSKLPDIPVDTHTAVAIDILIDNLLHIEGGYNDLKADRGGPTNFGITMATLAAWRGKPVTKDDVKALKRTEATDILRGNYFLLPGIDTLPVALQAHVFDMSVNHGPRTAVRLLQRALNNLGERLAVDGVIGDATRDACRKHDMDKINNELVNIRLRFYDDIVASDATQKVFINGWQRRAKMFVAGPGIAA